LVEPFRPQGDAANDGSDARAVGASRGSADVAAPADVPARDLDRIIERVAQSRISVLITGETGVGKDVLAKRIHHVSPRAASPFVAVNCAAFKDELIESELFGHERGAFTGADKARVGLFEAASGGTLFLDEVGELSMKAQAKLLRVLETRQVQRVGGLTVRVADVRVISATNRDLPSDVDDGRFRADLLFRLEGIPLALRPLRERPWEILPAAHQFLEELAARDGVAPLSLTAAAERALCEHGWAGNFRELRNVIERAAVLCDDGWIQPADLALGGSQLAAQAAAPGTTLGDGAERARIVAALATCAGNQSRAAKMLGISRRTLVARLDTYAISRPRDSARAGGKPSARLGDAVVARSVG